MPRPAALAVLTLLAAALGGLAAATLLAVRAPPLPSAGTAASGDARPRRGGDPAPHGTSQDDAPRRGRQPVRTDVAARTDATRGATGWSARFSVPDADLRHSAALELLRRGPSALTQARALRPSTDEGRELQGRLVDALRKMTLLRRGQDYGKLPDHQRVQLDLTAMATVVPEILLAEDRTRFWRAEVEHASGRAARGMAAAGEVALAELELLAARRDVGELDQAALRDAAEPHLASVTEWIATLEARPDVPPARVRQVTERLRALRP